MPVKLLRDFRNAHVFHLVQPTFTRIELHCMDDGQAHLRLYGGQSGEKFTTLQFESPQLAFAFFCRINKGTMAQVKAQGEGMELVPDPFGDRLSAVGSPMLNAWVNLFRRRLSQDAAQELSQEGLHLVFRHYDGEYRLNFLSVDASGERHYHQIALTDLMNKPFHELCDEAREELGVAKQLVDESPLFPVLLPGKKTVLQEMLPDKLQVFHNLFYDVTSLMIADEPQSRCHQGRWLTLDNSMFERCLHGTAKDLDEVVALNRDRTGIQQLLEGAGVNRPEFVVDDFYAELDLEILPPTTEFQDKAQVLAFFKTWADGFSADEYEALPPEEEPSGARHPERAEFMRVLTTSRASLIEAIHQAVSRAGLPDDYLQAVASVCSAGLDVEMAIAIAASLAPRIIPHIFENVKTALLAENLQLIELGRPPQWSDLYTRLDEATLDALIREAIHCHIDFSRALPFPFENGTSLEDKIDQVFTALSAKQALRIDNLKEGLRRKDGVGGEATFLTEGEFKHPITEQTLKASDFVDAKVFQQLFLITLYLAVDEDVTSLKHAIQALRDEGVKGHLDECVETMLTGSEGATYIASGKQLLLDYQSGITDLGLTPGMIMVLDDLGVSFGALAVKPPVRPSGMPHPVFSAPPKITTDTPQSQPSHSGESKLNV